MLSLAKSKRAGLIGLILSPALVTVFILIAVLFPLLWHLQVAFSEDTYNARYINLDMGLTTNAVYSIGGSLIYKYPEALMNYTYDMKQDVLDIYTSTLTQRPSASFPIIGQKGIEFKGLKTKPKKDLYLAYANEKLEISEEKPKKKYAILCPALENELFDKVTIMPLHNIQVSLPSFIRSTTIQVVSDNSIPKNPGLVIQIKRADDDNSLLVASAPDSSSIACNLAKILSSKLEVNANHYPRNQDKNIFTLEIGKAQTTEKLGEALNEFVTSISKE